MASGGAANLSGIEIWKASATQRIASEETVIQGTESLQVFPNPFSSILTAQISLPEQDQVILQLYNTSGHLLKTMFDGMAEAGKVYEFKFLQQSLPDGLYMMRLSTSKNIYYRKIMLIK